MNTRLAGAETMCPECGQTYARISQHWDKSNCTPPRFEGHLRELVTGIVLGGGAVDGNSDNKFIAVSTVQTDLARWLYRQLDWLGHSLDRLEQEGNRQPVYRVRTHAHSGLSPYRDWYRGETKRPPVSLMLTPLMGRVWWALAGGLQWHGEYDSQRTGAFSALADERAGWISRVLADAGPGFEGTRVEKRVQLRPCELSRWLDWIGESVLGVEYKWAGTREEYRALRSSTPTRSEK